MSFFHKKLFFLIFISFILEIKDFTLSLQPQNDGAIAQLVEQRTENPCVPGSIPGGTTCKIAKQLRFNYLAIFLSLNFSRVTYKVTYDTPV